MKLAIREDNIVARIGGDKFTILLTKIKQADNALKVAKKLITNISNSFSIEGQKLKIGCSIGIALFP